MARSTGDRLLNKNGIEHLTTFCSVLPRLLTVYLSQVCGSLYDLTFSLHRPLRYNYIPSRRPLLVRTRDKGGNRWIILPMWASSISTQWSRDSPRAPQCQTSSLHPGSSLLPIPACHLRARRMTPPPPPHRGFSPMTHLF